MNKEKWDKPSALIFIEINTETKRVDLYPDTVFVRRSSAGNGSLGAIDYINNHTKGCIVRILEENKFDSINVKSQKKKRSKQVRRDATMDESDRAVVSP